MVKKMSNFMNEVKIIGTGSYAPLNIVTNDDLSKIIETSDEWIYSRTGIRERKISITENTSDLSTMAAIRALENANIKAEEIDLIIVGTLTPDNFIPSTACMVQANIGAINATCFDISAACTGFIYGLSIATQFIKTGQSKTALVIGAETLSKVMNWEDRTTCVLFGDGAGAAILKISEDKGIISLYTGSDGSKADVLKCEANQLINPYTAVANTHSNFVTMDGREIFKFAVKVIEKSIEEVLKNTEYSLEDIKYIVPHQANQRIIEYCAKKLNVNGEKFYMNLDTYGNTSAASIPIAFDELVSKNLLNEGDKVIFVGFGGGLTWGAALISY
jgi:3-oxoacyl-[acyl-carrier-protein] synthase-3